MTDDAVFGAKATGGEVTEESSDGTLAQNGEDGEHASIAVSTAMRNYRQALSSPFPITDFAEENGNEGASVYSFVCGETQFRLTLEKVTE